MKISNLNPLTALALKDKTASNTRKLVLFSEAAS
jgi:hypothetical protein